MGRKVGRILLDMETILDELVDQDLQMGDILALVYVHLMVHRPDCVEEYVKGGRPEFYYGPPRDGKNEK